MKKIFFLLVFVLTLTLVRSQEFHYGVVAGANLATMKVGSESYIGNDVDNTIKRMSLGFRCGAFAEYSFAENIGLYAELGFSQYGYRMSLDNETAYDIDGGNTMINKVDAEERTRFNDMSLSLMLKWYMFDKHLSVDLGVQPSLTASVKCSERGGSSVIYNGEEMNSDSYDRTYNLRKNEYRPFNFSVVGGMTYSFCKNVFVSARYMFGLTDIFVKEVGRFDDSGEYFIEAENQLSKNRVIQIGLGWKF